MDKKSILKTIFEKKELNDYTYSILFFLISSFFLIFAIRPALSIAFGLKREVVDLRAANQLYEENILKLVELQSAMEQVRDRLYLLTEALPGNPDLYKTVIDIQNAVGKGNLSIKSIETSAIQLKDKGNSDKKVKEIVVTLQAEGSYEATRSFLDALSAQRRLKAIKKMQVLRDKSGASESATLKIITDIEAYYL